MHPTSADLSRIFEGIHPVQDDIPGRLMGVTCGVQAVDLANSYFDGGINSTCGIRAIRRVSR